MTSCWLFQEKLRPRFGDVLLSLKATGLLRDTFIQRSFFLNSNHPRPTQASSPHERTIKTVKHSFSDGSIGVTGMTNAYVNTTSSNGNAVQKRTEGFWESIKNRTPNGGSMVQISTVSGRSWFPNRRKKSLDFDRSDAGRSENAVQSNSLNMAQDDLENSVNMAQNNLENSVNMAQNQLRKWCTECDSEQLRK